MSDRYIRQRTLAAFGDEGQEKLKNAAVLVIGAGGLGVPALQYLNAMGTGRLGIVDADVVDLSNLHRQPIYTEDDLGKKKARVIGRFLQKQNSTTVKDIHTTFINRENALELISGYDLVIDASDNFATRYLVNDACVILGKPFVYGGLYGFEGQVSVFNFEGGPTYRCLYPEMPDKIIADCNTHGVLGIVPGIIGNFQALEAVKMITGVGEVLSGKLLLLDTLTLTTHKVKVSAVPENKEISRLSDKEYAVPCTTLATLAPENLEKDPGRYYLLDVREPSEFEGYHIAGSVNIPLGDLEERMGEVPTDRPVCLVCQQGVRTKQAAVILNDQGMDLCELQGGINQYLHSSKEV